MASAASRYCAQVNKCLTCPGSMKRPFLRQLKDEIDFYCEEHGAQTAQGLCAAFGTPEEVAEEFLAELSQQAVARCHTQRRKLLFTILTIVTLALIAAGALGMQSRQIQQTLSDEDFVASVTYDDESDRRFFWISVQDWIMGYRNAK